MKQRLLLVFAALLLCSWSVSAFACEHEKKASAAKSASVGTNSSVTAVTADAKAGCSAAQIAACKANGASAAHLAACKTNGASAAQASNCKAYGASVVTASAEHCAGKSASAARVASSGGSCCATKGAAKTTTAARMAKMDAVVAGSSCQSGATALGGHDCDACAELSMCDDELRKIGIETQVVPLKNGVMIVYTANGQGKAQAIQAAMARRAGRLDAVTASRDKAKLCGECKQMRGAMASGKLNRETVNIGGGVLTVMTSSDPKMVAKLQGMTAHAKT